MGSTYTITTDDNEDAAILFTAGNPDTDPQVYLEACVHGQLLQPWTNTYLLATAPVSPVDVGTSYAHATPEQQSAIHDILGLTPTTPPDGTIPPPDGGGELPPPIGFQYLLGDPGTAPTAGQIILDNADWTLATTLVLSETTSDGQDVASTLNSASTGSIFTATDSVGNSVTLTATAAGEDDGSSVQWPVDVTDSTGSVPTTGTLVGITGTVVPPPPPEPTILTLSYNWSTGGMPAGNGQFRTDTANWNAATIVDISGQLPDGTDVSADLATVTSNSTILVVQDNDNTKYAEYTVNPSVGTLAPPAGAPDFPFDVTLVNMGTQGNSGQRCTLTITIPPS
jgi:hypothetical protein